MNTVTLTQLNIKVELIDWTSQGWRTNWLLELFDKGTIAAICQISIGSVNNSDLSLWSASLHEEFTVRSAYHLQINLITLLRGNVHRHVNIMFCGSSYGR
jgi:hypothetical protein